MRRFLIVIAIVASAAFISAQEKPMRPVTSAYTVEFGTSHIADSYLTPLHYDGLHFGIAYERFQAMQFNPEQWIMQLYGSLSCDRDENRAGNATLWNLDLQLGWSMMRRWNVLPGLTLAAGGMTSLNGGALYLSRNGNNPVSAKAAWVVGATGMALYSMKLGRIPVTFRYQPRLPLIGAFFSPDYGELYYEIYLGNHSNLAHCAWPGNRFVFDQILTADLRLGSTSLRVGYSGHILNSKVNNIVTREYTHAFVVGISGEWLSLSPSGVSREAKIISAYY